MSATEKRHTRPSAKVKDVNNSGELQLTAHQVAHKHAVENLTAASDMPINPKMSTKTREVPVVVEESNHEVVAAGIYLKHLFI
jgi:hypothetical protein